MVGGGGTPIIAESRADHTASALWRDFYYMKRRTKVLLAKLGLDVHNRGVITVARQLRDAGMEVVYLGNALPGQIARSALEEDADVIGVSSLGGAHVTLGSALVKEAKKSGISDRAVLVMGGVFPPEDGKLLQEMGFDAIFIPGATGTDIVNKIDSLVLKKTQGSQSLNP